MGNIRTTENIIQSQKWVDWAWYANFQGLWKLESILVMHMSDKLAGSVLGSRVLSIPVNRFAHICSIWLTIEAISQVCFMLIYQIIIQVCCISLVITFFIWWKIPLVCYLEAIYKFWFQLWQEDLMPYIVLLV